MTERYGRAKFLEDAAWMGLTPEQAKSTIELRRRRDQLMARHHPDRGGEVGIAARINQTYARMAKFLNARKARRAPASPDADSVSVAAWKATLYAGAAQLSALALVATAGFVFFQKLNKK